jgi:glyoxylase-like metal-dependent hydrolase (beta-lactamase superfamily II)
VVAVKEIVAGLYAIPLGVVNAFLIDDGALTLIDTGTPGSAPKILDAVRAIGKQPTDLRHILITHCHADHSGSAAALKALTGAKTYMHPADAQLVGNGQAARSFRAGPGLISKLMVRLFINSAPTTVEPVTIDHELQDNDELPIGGGLCAVHVPGHCAGQLAFLWPSKGVLFVADAASHMLGRLGPGIVFENYAEAQRSHAKLAALDFDIACFGHGSTIKGGASQQFRQKWLPAGQASRAPQSKRK